MDKAVQHWIYNTPYIFIQNDSIQTSKRIYFVDKNTILFKNKYITEIYDCDWGHNYFLAEHISPKNLSNHKNLFIEGKPINSQFLIPYEPPETIKYKDLISNPMPFFMISTYFEKMKRVKNVSHRTRLTIILIKSVNRPYPLFRLILPNLDDRKYGIKESTLAKLYMEILNIPNTNPIAKQLLDKNKITKFLFSETLFSLIKNYLSLKKQNTSIYEIDRYLTYLEKGYKKEAMMFFINNLRPEDHKWLIMIILKESMYEKTILKAIHPKALDIYNMTMSLKIVSEFEGLTDNPIKLFQPIKPMLAKRMDLDKLFKKELCYHAERKYDGERIQIHKNKNKIMLFSRAGCNVTSLYSKIIPDLIKNIKATNCIIDGELTLWDSDINEFVAFGWMKPYAKEELVKTKKLLYFAFDIIYFEDNVLIYNPLFSRKKLLKNIINSVPNTLMVAGYSDVCNKEDVTTLLNDIIKQKGEGLVLKNPNSPYVPGSRDNEWIKIKPQYIKGLQNDLDVVIIGGYWSETRKNIITHFLTGIKNKNKILSFVKVGTGFTDIQRQTLHDELEPFWVKNKIDMIDYGDQKPDLYINPENSRVLTISGHDLQVTNKFSAGYSLRFPIFVSFRYDKDANDILTLQQLLDLNETFQNKTIGDKTSKQTIGDKTIGDKTRTKPEVLTIHKPADIENKEIVSNIFSNKEFNVFGNNKHNIEILIHSHGGTFVQNPNNNMFAIISNKLNIKINNFIKNYPKFPVVSESWIHDSIQHNKILSFEKYLIN